MKTMKMHQTLDTKLDTLQAKKDHPHLTLKNVKSQMMTKWDELMFDQSESDTISLDDWQLRTKLDTDRPVPLKDA